MSNSSTNSNSNCNTTSSDSSKSSSSDTSFEAEKSVGEECDSASFSPTYVYSGTFTRIHPYPWILQSIQVLLLASRYPSVLHTSTQVLLLACRSTLVSYSPSYVYSGTFTRIHLYHGLNNYVDTKAKWRHLKNWHVKGLCGRCCFRVYNVYNGTMCKGGGIRSMGFWASDR